jgi:hypothetical protein
LKSEMDSLAAGPASIPQQGPVPSTLSGPRAYPPHR